MYQPLHGLEVYKPYMAIYKTKIPYNNNDLKEFIIELANYHKLPHYDNFNDDTQEMKYMLKMGDVEIYGKTCGNGLCLCTKTKGFTDYTNVFPSFSYCINTDTNTLYQNIFLIIEYLATYLK